MDKRVKRFAKRIEAMLEGAQREWLPSGFDRDKKLLLEALVESVRGLRESARELSPRDIHTVKDVEKYGVMTAMLAFLLVDVVLEGSWSSSRN